MTDQSLNKHWIDKIVINGQHIDLTKVLENDIKELSLTLNFHEHAINICIPGIHQREVKCIIETTPPKDLVQFHKATRNKSLDMLYCGGENYFIDFISPKTCVEDIAEDMAAILLDSNNFVVQFKFISYTGEGENFDARLKKLHQIINGVKKYGVVTEIIPLAVNGEDSYSFGGIVKCRRHNEDS